MCGNGLESPGGRGCVRISRRRGSDWAYVVFLAGLDLSTPPGVQMGIAAAGVARARVDFSGRVGGGAESRFSRCERVREQSVRPWHAASLARTRCIPSVAR